MNMTMIARPVALVSSSETPRMDQTRRLEELFDRHYQRLYRLARRLSATHDDARDLVQETYLRAAQKPTSVPAGMSSEEAWLVRVLINLRRDEWRKAAVRRRYDREVRPEREAATDHADSVIARATVWRALDGLPPRRRAVVVLYELEGLATSAIASLLGVTAVTVRWHLAMGRRELTRVLTLSTGRRQ